jgi:F-type H+-transporting ATPase subunit alpha
MKSSVRVESFGKVTQVRMPLVTVTGLAAVKNNEIVIFDSGIKGQVLSFKSTNGTTETIVMVFDQQPIAIGSTVVGTGSQLQLALDDSVLGKIISPLGKSISGKSDLDFGATEKRTPNGTGKVSAIDIHPSPLETRTAITKQMVTGITYVDLLLPLAKPPAATHYRRPPNRKITLS